MFQTLLQITKFEFEGWHIYFNVILFIKLTISFYLFTNWMRFLMLISLFRGCCFQLAHRWWKTQILYSIHNADSQCQIRRLRGFGVCDVRLVHAWLWHDHSDYEKSQMSVASPPLVLPDKIQQRIHTHPLLHLASCDLFRLRYRLYDWCERCTEQEKHYTAWASLDWSSPKRLWCRFWGFHRNRH